MPTEPDSIANVIESLVGDVERRRELGERGRRFVECYHSLHFAGEMLEYWINAAVELPRG